MKVLFLTNNDISMGLFYWLRNNKNEEVILFKDKLELNILNDMSPDIVVSYNYKYIIKKDIIDFMGNKIINLHISLLPWNRGASPNIWSFLEDTPKGVTIHLIDEGLDTGDILLQKEIYFNEINETLESSYKKLHLEIENLFKENWGKIKNNKISPIPQIGDGSRHTVKNFQYIKEIIDNWNVSISEIKEKYKKLEGEFK